MGNGMNKVLPGLYVGNYRDSKDQQQLEKYQITHIIAIHDTPRRLLPDKHYLCIMAADTPDQNLSQYFSICNDFIHAARLREGNVLIHCLAGMSRSVTVAVAYIMTATNLNWKDALKVVRAGRAVANPNMGFQTQLDDFEKSRLADERYRLRQRYPSKALEQLDRMKCSAALDNYQELLSNRDICEGNCVRGEKCPTGAQSGDSVTNDDTQTEDEGASSSSCSGSGSGGIRNSGARRNVSYMISFAVEQWKTLKTAKAPNTEFENDASQEVDRSDPGQELMPNVLYFSPKVEENRNCETEVVVKENIRDEQTEDNQTQEPKE